jgi:predicted phosphoribosyltransferase/predicted alpha/beta-hydrolase family hydrolase
MQLRTFAARRRNVMDHPLAFDNRDGVKLVAEWLRPAGRADAPVVVFAHGWGSSRASPRNRAVAEALVAAGIGAFLLDLSGHGDSGGDAESLAPADHADDVVDAIAFLRTQGATGPIGVAGSSSGAAVAAAVAADATDGDRRIAALVLRAPSMATRFVHMAKIAIPTLVLQGEADPLLRRNRILADQIAGEHRLCTVPGAGHLFEEPGTLAIAIDETVRWFRRWLKGERLDAGGRGLEEIPGLPLPPPSHFTDRRAAGRALATNLARFARLDPIVVALPRGGIEVAEPIACALGCELDVFVSRKLRAPHQPELALGALAEGDVVVWNEEVREQLGTSLRARRDELDRVRRELATRVAEYRVALPRIPVAGRTIILVDDGVATGATLKAAITALSRERVARLVVALPGGAPSTLEEIARLPAVDDLVALARPDPFFAVGQLYDDFDQVSSEQVCEALRRHRGLRRSAAVAKRAGGE